MLDFKQIKELIELVADRGLDGVEMERSGFRLTIDGKKSRDQAAPPALTTVAAPPPAAASPPPAPVAAPAAEAEAAPAQEPDALEGAHIVTSPIVGTFYRAPSPESGPFVQVGDRVEKGQVLCIVEAMKLMNEIESDASGEILAIFPDNAQPVEFEERLFAIRPA